ncbi:MAG TPA: hypothetical protein VHH54_02210 [Actinomycetota bacterium]|nr:hypothetical protein [Actinomycetota bacterium]
MRTRLAALVLVSLLAACTGASPDGASTAPSFFVKPLPSGSTPSPLVGVQAGSVYGAVPDSWEARPLVDSRFPREGFIAAPKIKEWQDGTAARGMEVFWVDVGKVRIPSDYYYLAARGPALTSLNENKACQQGTRRVFVDRPPDLTGRRFSPSDYVVSGTAVCRTQGRATHWAYLVAAPGFGPVRRVGIRTSGLYVVRVAVTGARSKGLLKEIIERTRFGNASVPQILKVARNIA